MVGCSPDPFIVDPDTKRKGGYQHDEELDYAWARGPTLGEISYALV